MKNFDFWLPEISPVGHWWIFWGIVLLRHVLSFHHHYCAEKIFSDFAFIRQNRKKPTRFAYS